LREFNFFRGHTGKETKEIFLGFGGVWVVNNETASEAAAHCRGDNHFNLIGIFRVKLEHSPPTTSEGRIECGKEPCQSLFWDVPRVIGIAEPL
jgi:hypothetical protein